jgi:hypothetical protein
LSGEYQVDNNNDVYAVVDAATTYYWAVITGAATDTIFGALNAPGFAVEVLERPDLGTKALLNGCYAITGYPSQSFPPGIAHPPVTFVLSAPGYRDVTLSVSVPANPTFPMSAPAAAMLLLPVRIQGCVLNSTTGLPVAGVTILSVDNPSGPPPSVHTTALRAPLYFSHAAGAAVQAATIAPVGPAVTLTQPVTGGDQVVNLSNRTGVAVGSIVQLSGAGGVWLEYGVVASLGPGAPAAGEVFLTAPLNYSYPMSGAVSVSYVSATPTGAPATLSSAANPGDGFLLAPQLFNQTVVIENGTALEEIHTAGALTGADGYYALDGIGGVQEIFLQANSGSSPVADWFIAYEDPVNIVDFRV